MIIVLASLSLVSCASVAVQKSQVSIDGFEEENARGRAKVKVHGTDLGTNKFHDSVESLGVYRQDEQPTEAVAEPESLGEVLTLEIEASRRTNIPETINKMIDYSLRTKNIDIAERAYGLSRVVYDSSYGLRAAELWYELAPNSPHAIAAYVEELIISGRHEQLFDILVKRAQAGKDADFSFLANFAQITSEKQGDNLISSYNQYIASYPQLKESLAAGLLITRYKLARFLFYQKKYDKSLLLLNRVLDNSKQTKELNLLKNTNELKGRIYFLTQYPNAETFFKRVTREFPSSYPLNVYYALSLVENARASEAENLLLRFARRHLKFQSDKLLFVTLAAGAQQEKMTKLFDYVHGLFKRGATNEENKILLASLTTISGDFATSDKLLAEIPPSSQLILRATDLRLRNAVKAKELDKAEALLTAISGSNPAAHVYLAGKYATYLFYADEQKRAHKFLDELHKVKDPNRQLVETLAFTYYEIGEDSRMTKNFERLLDFSPDDPGTKNSYGYSLTDRGFRLRKAKVLIEDALKAEPENSAYVDSIGWWHYRNSDLQKAKAHLEWAYRQRNDPEIASHLAEVLWELGDQERANFLWQVSSEIFQESRVLQEAMERYEVDISHLLKGRHFFSTSPLQ